MTSPIIAFLAGAGTGYLKQRNVEDERKRAEEDRTWRNEQRDRQRRVDADADALSTTLKQSQAPAEVVEGPLGDQSAGPPIPAGLGQAPKPIAGQIGAGGTLPRASAQSSVMPVAAQMGSQAVAPAAPQVFRMVAPGGVNKSFNSAAEAQAAAKEYSGPEAANSRFVAAYRGSGHIDKALEAERNIMQGQAAKLQLDEATQARADKAWDQGLTAAATSAEALAQYFSGSPIVGGNQVKAVPGADGKTVQFVSLGVDGKQTPLYQPVDNNPASWAPLLTQMSRSLSPEARLQHMYRLDESSRAQAKDERDYKFKEKVHADDQKYKTGVLALRGSASGRGKGGNVIDPLNAGFDDDKAWAAAHKEAAKRSEDLVANGKQPMTPEAYGEAVNSYVRAVRDSYRQGNANRQIESALLTGFRDAGSDPAAQAAFRKKALAVVSEDQLIKLIPALKAPAPTQQPAAAARPGATQPKAPPPMRPNSIAPVSPAPQAASTLPPAANAAGGRLDKARADLTALRAGRAPGLKDGNEARAAYAKRIAAAQAELEAAESEYERAISPHITAAFGTRVK